MSSANVLPSAPPAETLYPVLAAPAENFRLTEISRIEKEISDQVEHYRLVLKKNKKARKAVHYSAVGLGAVSAALSSGAIAASLTRGGVIILRQALQLSQASLRPALPFSTRTLSAKSINTRGSSLSQLRSTTRLTAASLRR